MMLSPLRLVCAVVLAAASLAAQSKTKPVNFEQQIWPIFEKNCIECHRAPYVDKNGRRRKPKGKVRLDTKSGIQKSKKGKLVIAKKADKSMLVESITLPADDEDRMPPPKKGGPLAKAQIDLIKRWIDEGAKFGKWTGEKPAAKGDEGKPPKTSGNKSKSTGSTPKKKPGPSPLVTLRKGLKPVAAATLATFGEGPFRVSSVGDQSPLLRVTCAGHTDDVDDAAMAELQPLLDHITELDLARSQVGDGACATIAKMPRLTQLDLRQTRVTGSGVAAVAACSELRTLNLFSTSTNDYALAALAGLKKLQHLYVWQTDVSAKAVVKLREAIPNARIVFAANLPEPANEAPARGRGRR